MIKFTHGLLMGVSVLCAGSMTAHAQDITLSTSSPYQVESRVNYGASIRSCKAALIAPSWVLTARHCLGSKKVNNIKKHGKVTFTVTDEDGVNRQVVHNSKA